MNIIEYILVLWLYALEHDDVSYDNVAYLLDDVLLFIVYEIDQAW